MSETASEENEEMAGDYAVMQDQSIIILVIIFLIAAVLVGFTCYSRRKRLARQKEVQTLCKVNIQEGDVIYFCKSSELGNSRNPHIQLCKDCFDNCVFNSNPNWEKVSAGKPGMICHCGLRELWNPNVGIQRICKMHKIILRGQIQNKCQYIEVKGMRVPISPDGIPMVNLAVPIEDPSKTSRRGGFSTESYEDDESPADAEEKEKPSHVGLMIFGLFRSSLPKIAGENYRPGAWIPYEQDKLETVDETADENV